MIGKLIDNYRIKNELGRGAFGVVYEADAELGGQAFARVAVKFIARQSGDDLGAILKSLKALANFPHPHVVGYHYAREVQINGQSLVMLVLEFADGGTLSKHLQMLPMSETDVLQLAAHVSDGLDHLARNGLLHRDIKPDNLLRFSSGRDCRWKISDLGLARPASTDGRETGRAGTPAYMAPESWRGLPGSGSDVWALGLCLHEAVTGRPIWNTAVTGALEHLICNEPLPLDNDLPLLLKPLIEGCLQKDPSQRWSASKVRESARKALLIAQVRRPLGDFVVSPDGSGTHYRICDAIANAPAGATIVIYPGHYEENLVLQKDVCLVGTDPRGGEARTKVIVQCASGNALKLSAGRSSVQNITLKGTAATASARYTTLSIINAELELVNCALSSDSLTCVRINSGSKVAFRQCIIDGSQSHGILVEDEGSDLVLEACRIANCALDGLHVRRRARVQGNEVDISSCQGTGTTVSEGATAILIGCHIHANIGGGLHLCEGTRCTVKGGRIVNNKKFGVCAERGVVAQVEGCDLRGNSYAWAVVSEANVARIENIPNN